MSDRNPTGRAVSLDDLLNANKAQFDKVFAEQVRDSGLVGVTRRRVAEGDLYSASLGAARAAETADVAALLDSKFGTGWSSEVVEHKAENGQVTVLCKLSINGVSKSQFGSAPLNGDEGEALQRATDDALRKCAELFGAPSSTPASHGAMRHPGPTSPRARARPPSRRRAPRQVRHRVPHRVVVTPPTAARHRRQRLRPLGRSPNRPPSRPVRSGRWRAASTRSR